MRSVAASFSMSGESVRDPQQPQRMLGGTRLREAARDLLSRHWAVAGVVIGLCALDPLHHRSPDPDRSGARLALHAVGAVVPREIGRATSELQSHLNLVCRLLL